MKISNFQFPRLASRAKRAISKKGFTLIELLVVIAIIGLLASVVLVSLNSAKLKSRDARRLSDIQQIKSGLDIYYNLCNGYPNRSEWNAAQAAKGQLLCNGQTTLKVPQDPFIVGNPSHVYTYTEGGTSDPGGTIYTNYEVQFKTEGDTSIGPAGTYYLSPSNGISTTAPF